MHHIHPILLYKWFSFGLGHPLFPGLLLFTINVYTPICVVGLFVLATTWPKEFLGQESDLGYSCDLCDSSSNAGSLTHCAIHTHLLIYIFILLLLTFKKSLFFLAWGSKISCFLAWVLSRIPLPQGSFFFFCSKSAFMHLFNCYFPKTVFFPTVQHGDPVIYTCTHSIFAHYHAPL